MARTEELSHLIKEARLIHAYVNANDTGDEDKLATLTKVIEKQYGLLAGDVDDDFVYKTQDEIAYDVLDIVLKGATKPPVEEYVDYWRDVYGSDDVRAIASKVLEDWPL